MAISSMSTVELPVRFEGKPVVVIMGVSGSGKSTFGQALAQQLGLPFLEADDFHPVSNVDKMAHAQPLTDEDRWPWLASLSEAIVEAVEKRDGVVATCSALKRSYRRFILEGVGKPLLFVLLDGDRETLYSRMQKRSNHYMPPSLLDSQLADLERPGADEPVVTYSIEQSIDTLLAVIIASLSGTESS